MKRVVNYKCNSSHTNNYSFDSGCSDRSRSALKISYEEDVSVIVVLKDQPVPERRVGLLAQADYFSRRKR